MADEKTTIAEVIVWVSPVGFAFIAWLTHELYASLKEDVKQVKTSNGNIRTDLAKQAVQMSNLDSKVTTICASVEALKATTHELDKRTVHISDFGTTVAQVKDRADQADRKYGQILMILDGMAKRIGITFKKTGN